MGIIRDSQVLIDRIKIKKNKKKKRKELY